MARGPAHIQSPDVIKRFRASFVKFTEEGRRAIEDIQRDVSRVQQWLDREQSAHWKRELRKRDEIVQRTRSEYTRARTDSSPTRKKSFVDEKKAFDKAVRLREEAEQKLAIVKKTLLTLEQRTAKAIGPCTIFSSMLAADAPKALARLDTMLDKLDDYLRPAASGPSD
jgi:DNA repair exonuclease SbcCD ATPase subunit